MDAVAPEADASEDEDRPRDRSFNPFRYPKSDAAKTLVAEIVRDLEAHEERTGARKRKRKERDQETFEATVSALVCDLAHRAITEPEGWLAVSLSGAVLSRATRYRSLALNKTLPALLRRMALSELRLVELETGYQTTPLAPGRQSTMCAGPALLERIEAAGLDLVDLGRLTTDEVIILKTAKKKDTKDGKRKTAQLVNYKDTKTTRRYRDEVEQINAWLARADIEFDPVATPGRTIDTTERRLQRIFNNGKFDQGGRLFGGFWQPLNKQERHRGITINGERVGTLDYKHMAPTILYGMAGVMPPTQDAYTMPGFEGYRPGVKVVFNAMLYATKPLTRLPQGTSALLPRHTKISDIVERIKAVHAPIVDQFDKGIGFGVMYKESCVLVAVLLELMDRRIVGLPVHDALVVPQQAASEVTDVMLEVFERVTGVKGTVEVEDA